MTSLKIKKKGISGRNLGLVYIPFVSIGLLPKQGKDTQRRTTQDAL